MYVPLQSVQKTLLGGGGFFLGGSQKAAFVSPLINGCQHYCCNAPPMNTEDNHVPPDLAVNYYPIFLIERRNIWPI